MARDEHVGEPFSVRDPCVIDGHNPFASRSFAGRAAVAGIGMQHRIVRRHQKRMGLLVVEHVVEGGQPRDVGSVAHEEGADAGLVARLAQACEATGGIRLGATHREGHDLR